MTTPSGTYLDQPASHWEEMLSSNDPLVRRLGCYALGEIGALDEGIVAGLRATAVGDPEGFVRVWAAASLAKIDPQDQTALDTLVHSCTDSVGFVRSLAVWMLGRLDVLPLGEEAIAVVDRLLDDRDPSVRAEARVARDRIDALPNRSAAARRPATI